jgi:hypothetical protein
MPIGDGRFDESNEKRMGIQCGAPVFGVELCTYKPGMSFLLHNFHQSAFGIDSGGDHSMLLKSFQIIVVKLIAVAVAFTNQICLVSLLDL